MKFWMFLALAFVVLLSSCQIFFLAGVYEELQDRGIVSEILVYLPSHHETKKFSDAVGEVLKKYNTMTVRELLSF